MGINRNAIMAAVTVGFVWAFAIFPSVAAFAASAVGQQEPCGDVLYDDFSGDSLDSSKWVVAEKSWGGNNGGVVPQNVSVSGGTLKLEGHGNLYKGDVPSYANLTKGGVRTGAAIASREYYSSGSYEVRAKVAPVLGACSAIWTFEYEEYYPGDPEYIASGATGQYSTVNHEIDIEMPTANGTHRTPSFEAARFNTYTAENRHNSNFHDLPYAQDDGKFHTYRFDWHTGDSKEQKRVDFYVDGQYLYTSTKQVPTNASRFWIGLWFPTSQDADKDGVCETGWTGKADFDTAAFEIDSVKITPYCEAGDTNGKESFPYDGWALDQFPDQAESEHYNHLVNSDFEKGLDGWNVSGDAYADGGKGVLTSGAHTDTLSQVVDVKQRMTYKTSADIETDGTEIEIGARKQNGTCNTSRKYTKSGHVEFTFATPAAVKAMDIYAQVFRYSKGSVKIDNFSVMSLNGDTVTDVPSSPSPDTPNQGGGDSGSSGGSSSGSGSFGGSTPSPSVKANLVSNGDFSGGSDGWKLSGSAFVSNGKARLASGSDTDTVSRKVAVEGGKTYTLTANATSGGAELAIGVKDYGGRYTDMHKVVNADGTVSLTFTVAPHMSQIEVYAQALRYQANTSECTVDDISLVEGTDGSTVAPTPDTEGGKPGSGSDSGTSSGSGSTDVGNGSGNHGAGNLLQNGSFGDQTGWKMSGSAKIADGRLVLTSGSNTDDAKQGVKLESNVRYRLTVDVESTGCNIDIAAENIDGKYSKRKSTVSAGGKAVLEFDTGKNTHDSKISLTVLRYQGGDPAVISGVKLEKIG